MKHLHTKEKRAMKIKNIILGVIFAVSFVINQWLFVGKYEGSLNYISQALGVILLGLALMQFVPRRKKDSPIQVRKKLSKRAINSILVFILLMPATILAGVYGFGDRRYYFISIMLILEAIGAFFLAFEQKKPRARELVIISVLCAIAVAGRLAFGAIPYFKPVVAIAIIAGISLGAETGFLVGAITAFVSNFFFGQGAWTPWQMFAFGMTGFFAGLIFKNGLLCRNRISVCAYGFLAVVVLCGGIMNPASAIMMQPIPDIKMVWSCCIMGFPLDVIHGISTVFFLFFLTEPITDRLDRIKNKYGMI